MIVVNDPGTWSAVYPPLEHAAWHGWTYTDTIFPFFLFLVGVSMALSFARRDALANPGAVFRHVAVRASVLVGLGLVLNGLSFIVFHGERFRFAGVLQRIGLCVLLAGAVVLRGSARAAVPVAATLLLGYWALLSSGPLDPAGNLAARVDRAVLGRHTWKPDYDPEGLLSTLPAVATTLLGAAAGERLRRLGATPQAARDLFTAGTGAAVLGLLWGRVFPVNKSLWTSSYAVLTAGLAAIALAALVWVVDVRGARRWTAPFLWLGRNAIAAFVLSTLGAMALLAVRVTGADGKSRSLWNAIYRAAFDRFADPRLGSLLFALVYLALWTAVFGILYRRRIFLKI